MRALEILASMQGHVFTRESPCWIDLESFHQHYCTYDEWCEDLRLKTRNQLLEVLQLPAGYFYARRKHEVCAGYLVEAAHLGPLRRGRLPRAQAVPGRQGQGEALLGGLRHDC